MGKLNIVNKVQRVAIFMVSFGFFIWAAEKCISNYFEYQTASSLELLKSKNFYMPEFTVCLDETMNRDVLTQNGYKTSMSYILGPWQGKLSKFTAP